MVTAIVALLTAILGAVVGGFLRERADREALLCDRRLGAADDFIGAANEGFIALTEAVERVPRPTDATTAQEGLADGLHGPRSCPARPSMTQLLQDQRFWTWDGWSALVALGTIGLAAVRFGLVSMTRQSFATASQQISLER